MQKLIANEIEAEEPGHVSYEIKWVIPNFREVRTGDYFLKNQKATFETGQCQVQTGGIQSKWLVGLKKYVVENMHRTSFLVYWQLLDVKGSDKLNAKMCTLLCDAQGDPLLPHERKQELSFAEKIIIGGIVSDDLDHFINSDGGLQFILTLTLKKPEDDSRQFKRLKLEQFSKRSFDKLRENLGTLLNADTGGGDLKIITSDKIELRAHQSILKVQCSVFAGMFSCVLSESQTGILKVDDICGKTMRILLHYFYTGDLLSGWTDRDTILEFTYAAGKYDITEVLGLLDEFLGNMDDNDQGNQVSYLDVQLLNVAAKLSLKKAEHGLLQRISGKIAGAKCSKELFQLFGCDTEEIYNKAEKLNADQIGMSKVFETLDYAYGGYESRKMEFCQHGFVVLAYTQSNRFLRNLEKGLLKQIAEVVGKFTTAEELFVWFGESLLVKYE